MLIEASLMNVRSSSWISKKNIGSNKKKGEEILIPFKNKRQIDAKFVNISVFNHPIFSFSLLEHIMVLSVCSLSLSQMTSLLLCSHMVIYSPFLIVRESACIWDSCLVFIPRNKFLTSQVASR